MAMTVIHDIRMGTDGVIHSDEVRLSAADGAVADVGKIFGEGRQVIVGIGAIGDVMARGDGVADDALIGVQVGAGTRVARVVREVRGGRRWEGLEGIGDENLELGGVVDGAPLTDVPVGVGTGGNGLSLDGSRMERLHRDFFGHYIQKVVGLDGDSDRVIGAIRIGVTGITNEGCTAIRGVARGAQNAR
ncbi:MAG: hypothetical protein ACUVTG_15845 [Candidatus Oleimicrobiaceae bacterium]